VRARGGRGWPARRPVGRGMVGPIAEAVGVKETLLAAFALTMVSSLTLLAIPDMWRVTADAAGRPRVVPDETRAAGKPAQARERWRPPRGATLIQCAAVPGSDTRHAAP